MVCDFEEEILPETGVNAMDRKPAVAIRTSDLGEKTLFSAMTELSLVITDIEQLLSGGPLSADMNKNPRPTSNIVALRDTINDSTIRLRDIRDAVGMIGN